MKKSLAALFLVFLTLILTCCQTSPATKTDSTISDSLSQPPSLTPMDTVEVPKGPSPTSPQALTTVQATKTKPTALPSATRPHISPPAILEAGQVWVNPIDQSEMVGVPAGEFTMGDDAGDDDEQPEHIVYLDSFYIDKYEVTNAQYRKCVEEGACYHLQKTAYYDNPDFDQHPVVNVNLEWAKTYCKWARKRLPTEAEWEKAARGTDKRLYPWGTGGDCEHAQYMECGGETVPIGTKTKGGSPYGAMDMAGNVWEWVTDRYQEDYYQISPDQNPEGPTRGNAWVIRGGSWSESIEYIRSTYRSWYFPDAQYYNLGFRCVFD